MRKLDWNLNRHLTRDLLLEYDSQIMPPRPHSAGLAYVYPWENTSLNILNHQLYLVALANGFQGTEEDFHEFFSSFVSQYDVIFSTYDNFPATGISNKLYFDLEQKILYYWDNKYIPVNAMLITDTILNGGEA